ncbi:MAG: DUF4249 domain-containing protein [Bacteroidota bacterium]
MKRVLYLLMLLMGALLWSCEEEFIPEITTDPNAIVVEGYIEAGSRATPPFVILTRSIPFFQNINTDGFDGLFVRDAKVEVTNGDQTVQLTELCLQELSPEQQAIAGQLLGFDPDSIAFNFCAYVDLSFSMIGEEGEQYDLRIEAEDKTLTASTTIPPHVPLDSLRFIEPPGTPNDTLAELRIFLADPAGQRDFYRYQTEINSAGFQSPIGSVVDDRLFDGDTFEFPLAKAEDRNAEFDPATFGLYRRGDQVGVKWINIDEPHFNFWNTLEFTLANQGPFSNYTRVDSNIEGGLGIWGGLSASYYELEVPEEPE